MTKVLLVKDGYYVGTLVVKDMSKYAKDGGIKNLMKILEENGWTSFVGDLLEPSNGITGFWNLQFVFDTGEYDLDYGNFFLKDLFDEDGIQVVEAGSPTEEMFTHQKYRDIKLGMEKRRSEEKIIEQEKEKKSSVIKFFAVTATITVASVIGYYLFREDNK